jgi:hypothetical protein
MSAERIIDKEKLIGKTISAIAGDDDEYIIAFTDNTFLVVGAEHGYEDAVDITFEQEDFNQYLLVRMGLLTKSEYLEMQEEKERMWKEREEQNARATYAALKARFGNVLEK